MQDKQFDVFFWPLATRHIFAAAGYGYLCSEWFVGAGCVDGARVNRYLMRFAPLEVFGGSTLSWICFGMLTLISQMKVCDC